MSNKRVLVLAVLISTGMSQVAFADEDGSDSASDEMEMMSEMDSTPELGMGGNDAQVGLMTGNAMPMMDSNMMQMMMQMHRMMTSGGNQMGMTGGGNQTGLMNGSGRMSMMDRDMMGMMMPRRNPQNIGPHMAVKMREFDANSDGALTLQEFEALHTEAVRDRMVDRFQHLDADADGQVTQEEMQAAGARIGAMSLMNGG
jgi:hypothetical protein